MKVAEDLLGALAQVERWRAEGGVVKGGSGNSPTEVLAASFDQGHAGGQEDMIIDIALQLQKQR